MTISEASVLAAAKAAYAGREVEQPWEWLPPEHKDVLLHEARQALHSNLARAEWPDMPRTGDEG